MEIANTSSNRRRTAWNQNSWGNRTLQATMTAKAHPRSEERRVGKECRSLCDWSSDVCSSDLDGDRKHQQQSAPDGLEPEQLGEQDVAGHHDGKGPPQIGRASCRERV